MGRGQEELTDLSAQLGPKDGGAGPVEHVRRSGGRTTFDGNETRSATRCTLSQTAGRLGDSSGDLFGTVKNPQILVNALSASNEQIVQFSNHVASVSQVRCSPRARRASMPPWAPSTKALGDVRNLLKDNNTALINSVDQLASFTKILRTSTTTSSRSCMSRRTAWPTSTTSTTRPSARWRAYCRCRTSPTRCSSSAAATSRPAPIPTTTSGPRSAASGWPRCCAG